MINEIAHMFREVNPVYVVVDLLNENWGDVMEWTNAHVDDDPAADRPALIIPNPGYDDVYAMIGDVIVKQGDYFTVYTHDEWYGDGSEPGLNRLFTRIEVPA